MLQACGSRQACEFSEIRIFTAENRKRFASLYRRHMTGNSLFRNHGDGKFQNVAAKAGVEMGRWSWSTDAWDFDHDGFP